MIKKSFDTVIATPSTGSYMLRGKLMKREHFALCLIKSDLSDRWYKVFSPTYIYKIATKVGNVKKIMIFWEILSRLDTYTEKGITIDVLTNITTSSKQENHKNRAYLVIKENTTLSTISYPLPLDHMPFTEDELKENLSTFHQKIKQIDSIRILKDKEIYNLKAEINRLKTELESEKKGSEKVIEALRCKLSTQQQKAFDEKMFLTSLIPPGVNKTELKIQRRIKYEATEIQPE